MKRQLLLSALLLLLVVLPPIQAQRSSVRNLTSNFAIEGLLREPFEVFPAGTPITLQRFITHKGNGETLRKGVISINGKQYAIPVDEMKRTIELKPVDANTFWIARQLENGLVNYYQKHGLQQALRKEIEEDAKTYLDELKKSGLLYEDVALEDYLHCLMLDMMPRQFISERHAIPYVRLIKSPAPDILMLGNGCMLISTGMLTLLDSEEELYAMMSREVAHYVMDHAVITINKNVARANRAAFWGDVLEVLTVATEEYLASKDKNYVPGLIYTTGDVINSLVNANIMERMGLTYLPDQEKEADKLAIEYLQFSKHDPVHLTSALKKMQSYFLRVQDSRVFYRYQVHNNLHERVKRLQEQYPISEQPEDRIYLKQTASVVSFSAGLLGYNGDYAEASILAEKNINSLLASADDYVIQAQCLMKQSNSKETWKTCHALLDKADALNEGKSINATRQRILLLLRQERLQEATEQLQSYIELVNQQLALPQTNYQLEQLKSESYWAQQLLGRLEVL